MPKFTIEEFDKRMEEIRERRRVKQASVLGTPAPPMERLRQAMAKRLNPKLPNLPKV